MSFGYSISDFLALTQLAYTTVQNARKACGAHDSLVREVNSLHIVLQQLHVEVSKPNSILTQTVDNRKKELATLVGDCHRVLRVLSQILEKYNALSEEKRSVTKLWQRVKFGNGEMQDLGKIRSELATYTQAITLFVNLLVIGSQGEVEKYMDSHGAELREIKQSLHWVTASMQAKSPAEKSILTTYSEDDKDIWKAFRRELIKEGFSSQMLAKHKRTIQNYVLELGERGALDDIGEIESKNGESAGYRAETDRRAEEETILGMKIPEEALVERIALEDTLPGDILQKVAAEHKLGTTQNPLEESETKLDSPTSDTTQTYMKTPATAQSKDSMQETLLISSDESEMITATATDVDLDDIIDKLLKVKTSRPGTNVQLQEREILYLCKKAGEIFLSQPVLLELMPPIKIIGDIYGQYSDLLQLFQLSGYPPEANYLFLGNYVNFANQSTETICLLLAYKIKYPEKFFMLRGSHDCIRLTKIYGFYDECQRKYNSKIWMVFMNCLRCLPFAAVIGDRIFAINSGLSPDLNSMQQIRGILRPTDIPDSGLLCDLLSSRPDKDITGWSECDYDEPPTFGPDVVSRFLQKNNIDLICRSNQVVEDGYEFFSKRQLVTISSACNYKGTFDNTATIMTVDENLRCSFRLLVPAEKKPKKNPKSGVRGGMGYTRKLDLTA